MRSKSPMIKPNGFSGRSEAVRTGRPIDNQSRVEYAKLAIEQMARLAIQEGQSGTIGVEIPIKDGKLGKVKRLQIVFQPE